MLLHRKNESRDASSRSLSAIHRAGRRVRGIALDAEHELRAGEHALQRQLDAALEVARRAGRRVERHQALDVVVAWPGRDRRGAPASR